MIMIVHCASAQNFQNFGCHQQNFNYNWNRGYYGYHNYGYRYGGYGYNYYLAQPVIFYTQPTYYNAVPTNYLQTPVFVNQPATTTTTVTSNNQSTTSSASSVTITVNDTHGTQRSVTFTPPGGVRYVRYDPPVVMDDRMEINLYDENNRLYKQVYYFKH